MSRKREPDTDPLRIFSTRLPDSLIQRLKLLALKRRASAQQLTTEAIERYLKVEEKHTK